MDLGVFKYKQTEIKHNQSIKSKNCPKLNNIECLWMPFCENCLEWILITFSKLNKPNQTKCLDEMIYVSSKLSMILDLTQAKMIYVSSFIDSSSLQMQEVKTIMDIFTQK
jgi:hypothetical protein